MASEKLLELATVNLARELCSILSCQSISAQGLGNFYIWVESSPPSIDCGTMRLLSPRLVHDGQVAYLEIFSLELGCLV